MKLIKILLEIVQITVYYPYDAEQNHIVEKKKKKTLNMQKKKSSVAPDHPKLINKYLAVKYLI